MEVELYKWKKNVTLIQKQFYEKYLYKREWKKGFGKQIQQLTFLEKENKFGTYKI